MNKCDNLPVTERTECQVREYFEDESRGWSVEKLDRGGPSAADFHICRDNICFLCEVKTIESVHANLPWAPSLSAYEAERRRRRDEYDQWIAENPDSHLILNPTEYEFVYGEISEFRRQFRNRSRFNEHQFNEFSEDMRRYFTESTIVSKLPFSIKLDSDDLYVPYGEERIQFFKWLENELAEIWSEKTVPSNWQINPHLYGGYQLTTIYPIHRSSRQNDSNSDCYLSVIVPNNSNKLEVQLSSYGQLNLDAIRRNVESGLRQLRATVAREEFQNNPQVIVLAFASSPRSDWETLESLISLLLKENESLDAIAVLEDVPEVEPTPVPDGGGEELISWIVSGLPHSWETGFTVYHNTWHTNGHKETVTKAFEYNKNIHKDSHAIEIPEFWIPE